MSETIEMILLIFSATMLGMFCKDILAYLKKKLS